ncbi:MAG: efflux RND transporter periplasmic adaptor subunit [Methylococcales bacterium]
MFDRTLQGKLKWVGALIAVVGLMLLILGALGLIGGEAKVAPGNTASNSDTLPADAKTLRIAKQPADNSQSWPGSVQSRTVTKIAPKITARILSIAVHSGDKVKKGEVIAQLDQRQIQASLSQAEAALVAAKTTAAQAQRDAQRSQTLFAHEATTRANHEAALAQAQITQAAVSQAADNVTQIRVGLGDTTLVAPFDGIISERLKEPGDMSMPGDPLVTLLKPEDLRIEAAIPSDCAKRIQLGMIVNVRLEALATNLQAKVDEIVPQVDRQTGTQLLKAAIPKTPGLQPGQFAWLELSCTTQQSAIFIPVSAVLQFGQLQAVKVVTEDHKSYTRHIRTGKRQSEQVEVLSGLREGETILIDSSRYAATAIKGK